MIMKRVGEEEVNAQGATKRAKRDGIDTRWLIRGGEVGAIIGKKGSTVKRIREESGSCVSILNKTSVKTSDQVMLIRGSEEVIAHGVRLVAEAIMQSARERDPSAPEETTLTLLVPAVQVGAIIGKGGEMIKSIIAETAANLKISKEALQNSTEKSVGMTGNSAAIAAATTRVLDELKNHPVKEGTARQPYRPEMLQDMLQQPQMNPYQNQWAGMAGMGGMGMQQGMGAYPPMQQQQMPRAQPMYVGNAMAGQPSQVTTRSVGEDESEAGLKPGQVMQKVSIPSVSAGSVIGKRGAMIQQISKSTGCNIIIANPEEEAQYERIVTLKGSPEGIDSAITLIRQVIEGQQSYGYSTAGAMPAY